MGGSYLAATVHLRALTEKDYHPEVTPFPDPRSSLRERFGRQAARPAHLRFAMADLATSPIKREVDIGWLLAPRW